METESEDERIALLVHEVRSPVAALRAIAEAVREDDLDRESMRELAHLAVRGCRSIERIVGDAALGSFSFERVQIGNLLRDAVAAAVLAGGSVVLAQGVDLEIEADPVRLRQALDNLIHNALLHSQSAGDVVIHSLVEGDFALVRVSDSGPGIVPADQKRIFEPRARLDSGREGRGLGLWVVRAVAEAHGGNVTVDSQPGEGSTFTLRLPLRA